MKVYFDTEFTGLRKDTSLISLGLIDENGRSFYLEFKDYDESQCDEWIEENVLKHTIMKNHANIIEILANGLPYLYCTKEEAKESLIEWFKEYKEVQLVSDVCHYDMTLFVDIFGTAFDLPENVSVVCHDINQDIARYFNISDKRAFDLNREEILERLKLELPKGDKHNSLYDACVIKSIDEAVNA